jgi:hypothetical protein
VNRAVALLLLASAALAGPAVVVTACSRRANIYDDPDAGSFETDPTLEAGDVPEIDSGIGSDSFPPCAERPFGECQGPVDFPCNFAGWVTDVAAACQEQTGCKTNGWLEVTLGDDGCVASLGMHEPNDEIVACLVERLGALRCPCEAATTTYYFGVGHSGGCDAGPPI